MRNSNDGTFNVSADEGAMLSWMSQFAPYGVITTDVELRVTTWNRWMETNSDWSARDVLGRPLFDLFPDLRERRLPGQFERALKGEVSVVSTGLHGYLLPLRSPLRESGFDQMQQTARIAPLVLNDRILGTIIVIEDVTQREHQALILRLQHERDQILSCSLAHLLWSKEPRRSVRELFYKIAEFLDYDAYLLYLFEADGSLKLHSAGGVSPEDEQALSRLHPGAWSWMVLSPSSGEPQVVQHIFQGSGEAAEIPRQLRLTAYVSLPMRTSGRDVGYFCMATRTRDTIPEAETELLKTIAQHLAIALDKEEMDLRLGAAQQQLREYAQNLEKQVFDRTARLTEIIAELETFSYSLAHDLRAPIRALNGYCTVLIEDYGPEISAEPRELITKLLEACDRLDALTRDLLDFSRVSRDEIRLVPVAMDDLLADVVAFSPGEMRAHIRILPSLHKVMAHRNLLQRCIANLLENALKFVTPGTKPDVTLRTELVTTEASRDNGVALPFSSAVFGMLQSAPAVPANTAAPKPPTGARVRIWVEDRGIGVPDEAQSKIFGIFERGTRSRDYEGTGIGLAIVARAIQRMGGACGVESQPGQGSRFWLELAASEE